MIRKLYLYFVNIFTGIIIIFAVFGILYFISPNWVSNNIISQIISHDNKVFIRKNFIEKNFKKHINTIDQNQFINLGFKKLKLGFDYNDAKNLNHNHSQNIGHIDIWNDNLILVSSEGNFYYFKNSNSS